MINYSCLGLMNTSTEMDCAVQPASDAESVMDQRPALPIVAGDQTMWADASIFFSSVCTDLQVGDLIHGQSFSLFEAMSALEIMDPKMDAGITTVGFETVDKAVDSGAAPINLSVSQLIDVMDHLLSCEATWHKGHSLAQTVFSCIYLLKLDRTVSNAILYAYCKITRATCSVVRSAVAMADIHEEEDVFTVASGLPLEAHGDDKCLLTLSPIEESIARNLRGCKGGAVKGKSAEGIEPLQGDPELEEGFCQAILCRLRFRKALYHALVSMEKPHGRGLELSRKHIVAALFELEAIRSSSKFLSTLSGKQLGETCKTSQHPCSTASGQPAIGFEESVNRRLLAPSPPRCIKIVSWGEALEYFEQLLNDLDRICSVPSNLGLEELLYFVVDFQKSRPELLARARLQLHLLRDGKLLGRELISEALCKFFNLEHEMGPYTTVKNTFEVQAGCLMLRLFRLLCTNPSWQRRKLGRVIHDWESLLQHVAVSTWQNPPGRTPLGGVYDKSWWSDNVLLRWAAEQTCWLVSHFLMLGFELELYSPCEYSMVYWYLDHVLLTLLHYKVAKQRTSSEQAEAKPSDSGDSLKKKGKKKKASTKGAGKDLRLSATLLLLQCYSNFCKGLVWMLAALMKDGKFIHRNTIFNNEQERFVQRFELLQKILEPEPAMYHHFREATRQNNASVKELYQLSYDHFMTVQQILQELGQIESSASPLSPMSRALNAVEIKQMEQVALRNKIALQIAHQAGPGDNLKVTFEFSQHPCFAVAVVKKA